MRTDGELVEASRRGEHAAFGELVDRYQDVVCAVSYSSTGDRSISEDVAQETFVAAWQTLDRLRDAKAPGPWLCGIARNIGRKTRKRGRPDKRVTLDESLPGGTTPYEDTAQAETERVVSKALESVPVACREVLVLYYRENHSIRDVAVALGLSEDAVMQRLSRGRRYLAAEVTSIVESSLRGRRSRRDLVAAVLASIAAIVLPSRVDASPTKGSTVLKISLAASALVAVGAVVYTMRPHHSPPPPPRVVTPALHYGRKDAHPQLPTPRTLLAPAVRAQVADDLALLPADSEIVLGIDLAQLRKSGVWQRFAAPALAQAGLDDIKAKCGFDPVESIESMSFGLKGINRGAVAGTIVVHGLDKSRTLACLATRYADAVKIDGDVVMLAGDTNQAGLTFINDRTLVLVAGNEVKTKEDVLRAAAGGGQLETSPMFADLFQNIHSEDAMWVVVAPSVPLFADANREFDRTSAGEKLALSAVYGSIDVSDSLVFDARLRLGSPAQVAFWVSKIKEGLAEPAASFAIAQFFDAIDVTPDDDDVRIDAAITADQLAALTSFLPTAVTSSETDDAKSGSDSHSSGVTINFSVTTK